MAARIEKSREATSARADGVVLVQLMRWEPGPKPHRFVYYLRKNPIGRIVVQIRRYPTADVVSDHSVKTVSLRD